MAATTGLSTNHLLRLAFLPGGAESLKKAANDRGNLAWYGLAEGVRVFRNGFYIGITILAIGILGMAATGHFIFKATIVIGIAAASLMGKRLYESVAEIQTLYKQGCRLN